MRVEMGDIIGVSLPTQNPLPIVASGATGYNLKTHNVASAPSMIQQSTLTDASNMALHLYPKQGIYYNRSIIEEILFVLQIYQ